MQPGPFGPFVLLEPLARGGMGEVWLARQFGFKGVKDVIVVKVTRADQADNSEARQRFSDETRIAVLLAHPCIARTVDAGRADGMDYLALEAVDGIPLLALLQRMGERHEPLPDHVALYAAACALDGLAFAHSATHPLTGAPLGVVHRDISPHNIMVAADGAVKVIDFGVALSTLKTAQTEQGIVVGKMAYMSPEQARGGAVDARADVFAVAVVLYELLAGERYYPNMSADAIWRVAGTGTYVPPALARLETDIQRVLTRGLQPDPNKRTQSAAAMRAEVAALLMLRGGATRAAQDLAALVRRHASEELARMARARVAAQNVAPPAEDVVTDSIASAEVKAIDAAVRAQPADPVTVRLETVAMMPAVGADTLVEMREADVGNVPQVTSPSRPPATLRIERANPPRPRAEPPTLDLAPKKKRTAPLAMLAGAGAVAVLAVGLAALAWPRTPSDVVDAGAAGVVDAGSTSGVVDTLADAGGAAPADAGMPPQGATASAMAIDAGAMPEDAPSRGRPDAGSGRTLSKREKLIEAIRPDLRAVSTCKRPCAQRYRGVSVEGKTQAQLESIAGALAKCRKDCKQ